MSLSISSIGSIPSLDQISANKTTGPASSAEFGNILKSTIKEVENAHATADAAIKNFVSGGEGELHSTILATQKAEMQFDMFMQIRNKVVSAYQEVMRIQV